jgi:hypothetical protein
MGIGVGPGGNPRRFQIKCQNVKSAKINGKNIVNIFEGKLEEWNNNIMKKLISLKGKKL